MKTDYKNELLQQFPQIDFESQQIIGKFVSVRNSDFKTMVWNPQNGNNTGWIKSTSHELINDLLFFKNQDKETLIYDLENGHSTGWNKLESYKMIGNLVLLNKVFLDEKNNTKIWNPQNGFEIGWIDNLISYDTVGDLLVLALENKTKIWNPQNGKDITNRISDFISYDIVGNFVLLNTIDYTDIMNYKSGRIFDELECVTYNIMEHFVIFTHKNNGYMQILNTKNDKFTTWIAGFTSCKITDNGLLLHRNKNTTTVNAETMFESKKIIN